MDFSLQISFANASGALGSQLSPPEWYLSLAKVDCKKYSIKTIARRRISKRK